MVVEYVRYDLTAHSAADLVAAYQRAAVHLIAAPECLSYEVSICEEAPRAVVVRIGWSSLDAHLQGFRKGPHFPPFLAQVRPFVGEIAEMRHYNLTDVSWSRP